ncbi:hypothetical protein PGT21_010395 [Puccinia graminis f. sp. tritici]|uniref:Uncharacterized protein n=1 Tax=Puccinia graminis f. sp. tritici TaxID=56615 RepID=A0A5B0NWQ3_PUCGR|nr:hypothetical protein PGT21_010395 [Puccinia graminis f. sp. tritici]KAA1093767.1 hypothetical protein PGTUg99_027728 [Puccinia graminis f. sp. tritici]
MNGFEDGNNRKESTRGNKLRIEGLFTNSNRSQDRSNQKAANSLDRIKLPKSICPELIDRSRTTRILESFDPVQQTPGCPCSKRFNGD